MTGRPMLPIADTISLGAILGVFAHVLPPLAAFIAIIWYCLEMYESKTVQGFLRGRRRRHLRRQRHLRRTVKTPPAVGPAG